nr:ATP-binding protein [bacterium]
MVTKNVSDEGFQEIPFRMHPRVFAALGADLVTNDVVAVIELVKNSYDALAENVWISFELNEKNEGYLEIKDDGCGMNLTEIENIWCLVATPNKKNNKNAASGDKIRRVVGEKGLGRLSAARLGKSFHMVTQTNPEDCWEVKVEWDEIAEKTEMSSCNVKVRPFKGESPFGWSGTRIRISNLNQVWDTDQIDDLEDNLARLISPFEELKDFSLYFSRPGQVDEEEPKIESPEFLANPKYSISGEVDKDGNVSVNYKYMPIFDGKSRKYKTQLKWQQVYEGIKKEDKRRYPFDSKKSHCGSFFFEIRAWDLGADDTEEIATKYALQKSKIRQAIWAHKGISVYRDGILVLPKSDNARDWLGLDLRRVSKVGTRLSTSQIVGYVSISADNNPAIGDTSDRERLVSRLEVAEFEEILKQVVSILENARDEDREKK